MGLNKIIKCTAHDYHGGSKGAIDGCTQCVLAAKADRWQVQLYNPSGCSDYRKTIRGKRVATAHEAQMRTVLSGGGMAGPDLRNRTFRGLLEEILAAKSTLSAATVTTYDNTCRNHLWPAFGVP